MSELIVPEIRYLPGPEGQLARQAQRINDAAHEFKLSWNVPNLEHYVAIAPETIDRVTGVIEFDESPKFAGERYGEIHITRIAVRPGRRRNGIGSALVAHVVQLGREAGYKTISVQPINDESKELFGKHDFVVSTGGKRLHYFRYLDLDSPPEIS